MVLVKDVKEGNLGGGPPARQRVREGPEMRELAEEQGWVARMVHLFRNDDLGVQYEVGQVFAQRWASELMWDSYYKLPGSTSRRVVIGLGLLSRRLLLRVYSLPDVSKQEKER